MFTYIYVITNGGPGFDTNVAEFQIYYQWFTNGNAGYACAMASLLVAIIIVARPVPDPRADPDED